MSVTIPDKFNDLLERPVVISLVTVMPDGQPQATPVWFSYDGSHVWVNTAKGRQKDRNMRHRSKVTLLAIDPENPYHWMEARGEVDEVTEEGAIDHINSLSAKYRDQPDYYARNPEMRGKETRVIFKIKLNKVIGA